MAVYDVELNADWHKLMEDGAGAAKYFFYEAIEIIDKKFGEGYSKEHPELIGAFMNAAAKDNQATIIGKCLLAIRTELSNEISSVALSLEGIADALDK